LAPARLHGAEMQVVHVTRPRHVHSYGKSSALSADRWRREAADALKISTVRSGAK
jgi:hypothetical protein